jgi:4-hydroxythreonine-4-phosphate dehydrogenase
MKQKVRVGISIGDINGIGPEVIIRTLNHPRILELCTPVIYGSAKVIAYHKNVANLNSFNFSSQQSAERLNYHKVNVINCWEDTVNINLGQATEEGGRCAHIALDRSVRDLKEGHVDVLVTGPVNKHAMQLVNFPAPGHTEYLEKELGGNALMLMTSDRLKIAVVTGHIPLRDVAENITRERVVNALVALIKSLTVDFGIDKPKIAMLGLNPHASDNGLMGDEEEEILQPVIKEAKKNGHLVMGPYSADGFFGSGLYTKFDGVLAMYHDQALIPFKTLAFGEGVNYTAGLDFVRTSPDHGTAYDLVGKNEADERSFRHALYTAVDVFRRRREFAEITSNSLRNQKDAGAEEPRAAASGE